VGENNIKFSSYTVSYELEQLVSLSFLAGLLRKARK
jgi:hypothetical protein